MTWNTYYNGFLGWVDRARLRHISHISDFGPTNEICEIAEACVDKKAASKLICRALMFGVQFTSEEIVKLKGIVDETLYSDLIKSVSWRMN